MRRIANAMLNEEFRKIFVHNEQKSTIISHFSFLISHFSFLVPGVPRKRYAFLGVGSSFLIKKIRGFPRILNYCFASFLR